MPLIKVQDTQNIDKKDKKILRALFEDGRMSIANIAKRTKLRRDTIARRIKKLRKNDVITSILPTLNPPALGYPNLSVVLFRVRTLTDSERTDLDSKLKKNKFIIHISKLIGKYDYYCAIVYEDAKHLHEIVDEIEHYIPNLIEAFEFLQVVDEPKFERMEDLL
ncbi:Lrp/AsnC family transcriptional regulator [Nanoarchaeota archaeon]